VDVLHRSSRIGRGASLLSLGALSVHDLRYLLAYGRGAGEALAQQGHGYMSELGGALVVLALATLLATLLAGAISPPPRRADEPAAAAFRRTAMLFALALATIFCAQELTEGALAVGHPAGLAGVLAHGGWVFAPLALAIGALCSLICLVLRGVDRALACITRPRRVPRRAVSLPQPNFATARRPLVLLNLGFGFARRPPPLLPAR